MYMCMCVYVNDTCVTPAHLVGRTNFKSKVIWLGWCPSLSIGNLAWLQKIAGQAMYSLLLEILVRISIVNIRSFHCTGFLPPPEMHAPFQLFFSNTLSLYLRICLISPLPISTHLQNLFYFPFPGRYKGTSLIPFCSLTSLGLWHNYPLPGS